MNLALNDLILVDERVVKIESINYTTAQISYRFDDVEYFSDIENVIKVEVE